MDNTIQLNRQGLVVSWAVAECGVGGVMHALKIPFTGIFVGSIAVICISLMVLSSRDAKNELLKSLVMVLLIKLAASPHSPWQAYVAVIFQGLLGSILLKNDAWIRTRIFVFAVVCLLESSLQKVIISVLVFGLEFFNAIDLVLNSITSFFGVISQTSYSILLMSFYLAIHLFVGIVLGLYIPNIPSQLDKYADILLKASNYRSKLKHKGTNIKSFFNVGYLILASALILVFHLYLPPHLIWLNILLRALLVTLFMTLAIGPIFKYLIKRWLTKGGSKNILAISAQEIISEIPDYKSILFERWSYIRLHFKGLERINLFLLSAITVSHSPSVTSIEKTETKVEL